MSLIKEKIKFNNQNNSIKLNLINKKNVVGLQQSINNFIEQETGLSINPANDGEKLRYLPSADVTYSFNFFNITANTFSTSLNNAGFTNEEISTINDSIIKSFYIVQIYDNFDSDNQTLLHTGYYNGFSWALEEGSNSVYSFLNKNVEFTNYYFSNNFIDTLSGQTTNLYSRFYFYNAKNGRLQVFLNQNNENLTTEEKLYFTLTLNPVSKTYTYLSSTLLIKETRNNLFIDKINNTLTSLNNEKQIFPSGNLFNTDGTYENI